MVDSLGKFFKGFSILTLPFLLSQRLQQSLLNKVDARQERDLEEKSS